jgi:hypothetical protein
LKSNDLNNVLSDTTTYITTNDIEFSSTSAYRLQRSTIKRDDTGSLFQVSWPTFNYHEDNVSRFPDSIDLFTNPTGTVANNATINVYVIVHRRVR